MIQLQIDYIFGESPTRGIKAHLQFISMSITQDMQLQNVNIRTNDTLIANDGT